MNFIDSFIVRSSAFEAVKNTKIGRKKVFCSLKLRAACTRDASDIEIH
jgi:hypothetical protein